MSSKLLVIACGAIARELIQVQQLNGWDHIEFQCLPAELHNTPDKIPAAVEQMIESKRKQFDEIFVAYADCGTGGLLDSMLEKHGVERIPGAHCYEFYTGSEAFTNLSEQEPGTFYLTDFLVRSFDRLVKEGLGLERYPELMSQYFGNYRRVVYLAQSRSEDLQSLARRQAQYLGLEYEYVYSGLEPLNQSLNIHLSH